MLLDVLHGNIDIQIDVGCPNGNMDVKIDAFQNGNMVVQIDYGFPKWEHGFPNR